VAIISLRKQEMMKVGTRVCQVSEQESVDRNARLVQSIGACY
jgi:hypothetical protein